MKIKSAAETAQLGKAHAYLGHFAKAKHINRGHNSDPIPDLGLSIASKAAARNDPSIHQYPTKLPNGEPSGGPEWEKAMQRVAAEQRRQKAIDAAGDAAAKRAEDSQSKYQTLPISKVR